MQFLSISDPAMELSSPSNVNNRTEPSYAKW
jgi:hypothetical protein